jgi:hypothetical protein
MTHDLLPSVRSGAGSGTPKQVALVGRPPFALLVILLNIKKKE